MRGRAMARAPRTGVCEAEAAGARSNTPEKGRNITRRRLASEASGPGSHVCECVYTPAAEVADVSRALRRTDNARARGGSSRRRSSLPAWPRRHAHNGCQFTRPVCGPTADDKKSVTASGMVMRTGAWQSLQQVARNQLTSRRKQAAALPHVLTRPVTAALEALAACRHALVHLAESWRRCPTAERG